MICESQAAYAYFTIKTTKLFSIRNNLCVCSETPCRLHVLSSFRYRNFVSLSLIEAFHGICFTDVPPIPSVRILWRYSRWTRVVFILNCKGFSEPVSLLSLFGLVLKPQDDMMLFPPMC